MTALSEESSTASFRPLRVSGQMSKHSRPPIAHPISPVSIETPRLSGPASRTPICTPSAHHPCDAEDDPLGYSVAALVSVVLSANLVLHRPER
jgi:hypothetical protein